MQERRDQDAPGRQEGQRPRVRGAVRRTLRPAPRDVGLRSDVRRHFRRPWSIAVWSVDVTIGGYFVPGGQRIENVGWHFWTYRGATTAARALNEIAPNLIEYRVERRKEPE